MRATVITIAILSSCFALSQVELAIQKGHSASISQLEFSKNGEFLLSFGENNEGIVWDLKLSKTLTNFKLPSTTIITGIKFVEDDRKIKLQSESSTYFFDLETDKMLKQLTGSGHSF